MDKPKKNKILTLVEALWDSIATPPKVVEVPGHHKEIIEKRLKTLKQATQSGKSWEKIRQKYL